MNSKIQLTPKEESELDQAVSKAVDAFEEIEKVWRVSVIDSTCAGKTPATSQPCSNFLHATVAADRQCIS